MEQVNVGAVLVGAGALVLVAGLTVRAWLSGRRHGRVELARVGTTAVPAARVLATAGVIVGVQWSVLTYAASNVVLVLAVLGVPALVAAYTVTKALAVTEVRSVTTRATTRRGGGRW